MPEALARADYDYTVSEEPPPRRRARPRNPQRLEPTVSRVPPMREDARAPRILRVMRACVHKPLRTILTLACAAVAVSFVTNLLFMQDGPHPAPLFAKHEPKAPAPAAQRQADASSRVVRSIPAPPASDAPTPPPAPRSAPPSVVSAPPAKPAEPPKATARQPEFDPIAQFLKTGASQAPATTASTTAPANASETKRVAAAQRALTKVGISVEADGVMGPGTRAAIQKFERDNKLPVTGDLNPRTVKALSARASISIP